jgi:hypothetical protein
MANGRRLIGTFTLSLPVPSDGLVRPPLKAKKEMMNEIAL